MKILFLTDNFIPEVNAPATRTYEHAKIWSKLGVEVTIITCNPNFPQGKIYSGYKNKIITKQYFDGLKVIRVWSYMSPNSGFLKRTFDYLSYALMATIFGVFEKADVIVATSPQFFTVCSGWLLSKLKTCPWIFELRDLWPESIAALGSFNSRSFIYKIFENVELALYRSADLIVPNSPAFKHNLIDRGICSNKIHVIPNGVDLTIYDANKYDNKLKDSLGIQEDFIEFTSGSVAEISISNTRGIILY